MEADGESRTDHNPKTNVTLTEYLPLRVQTKDSRRYRSVPPGPAPLHAFQSVATEPDLDLQPSSSKLVSLVHVGGGRGPKRLVSAARTRLSVAPVRPHPALLDSVRLTCD